MLRVAPSRPAYTDRHGIRSLQGANVLLRTARNIRRIAVANLHGVRHSGNACRICEVIRAASDAVAPWGGPTIPGSAGVTQTPEILARLP